MYEVLKSASRHAGQCSGFFDVFITLSFTTSGINVRVKSKFLKFHYCDRLVTWTALETDDSTPNILIQYINEGIADAQEEFRKLTSPEPQSRYP